MDKFFKAIGWKTWTDRWDFVEITFDIVVFIATCYGIVAAYSLIMGAK